MALPISTSALVVPLRALRTTIFGSVSAVMSWLTWCILSGFPTEVPPNFMIFIECPLFFRTAKIRAGWLEIFEKRGDAEFGGKVGEVGYDILVNRYPTGAALRFHLAFGVAGYENARLAGNGGGGAKTVYPLIH